MRKLLFFLLTIISFSALSADYGWKLTGGGTYVQSQTYPTPSAACTASGAVPGSYRYTDSSGRIFFGCHAQNGVRVWDAFRIGDSCPNPETDTYNAVTGECETPEPPNVCSDTEGMGTVHSFLANTRSNEYDPWPATEPTAPYAVCRQGCRFTGAGGTGTTTCGSFVGGSSLEQYCLRVYTGIGAECSEGDAPYQTTPSPGEPADGDPDDPLDFPPLIDPDADPTDPANTCGPGYEWTGTTCARVFTGDAPEASPDAPAPGSAAGGTPSTSTPNPDDPDGPPIVIPGGSATNAQNPNNVLGTACTQQLQCTGDSYQCAMLLHQKKLSCQSEENSDFEGTKADIQGLFTGDQFELDEEEDIELDSIISQATGFLPRSCPPPQQIATSGGNLFIDHQPFCSFATLIRPLVLGFCAIFCALYVGRAFGGE